jgi:hypothetical protein
MSKRATNRVIMGSSRQPIAIHCVSTAVLLMPVGGYGEVLGAMPQLYEPPHVSNMEPT